MLSDTIEEIKNNPKWLFGTLALVFAIVSIGVVLMSEDDSQKAPPSMTEIAALAPEDGIPSDIFDTPFKQLKPKPEPTPPPKKEKKKLSLEEVINIKQAAEPHMSRDEILRRELLAKRRKKGRVQIAVRNNTKAGYDYKSVAIDQSRDDDFSAHNLAKSIATYPVDLSRTLTADRFIPAVLYTEIKSELPSEKVLAMIESDVYAAHGRKILIPRGSKAIGKYEPLDEQGATRLMVNWYRIITPNGINIKLDSELADMQGAAGTTGEIDNRYKEKYGTALLFSTVSALAQLSVDTENDSQSAAAESFSDEFGSVTAEELRNSMDIMPRVRIERGARINISILTDLWFKPPLQGQSQVIPTKDLQVGGKYAATQFQMNRPGNFQNFHTIEVKNPVLSAKPLPEQDAHEAPLLFTENDLPANILANQKALKNNEKSSDFHNEINVKSTDKRFSEPDGVRTISDNKFRELLLK